MKALTICQPYPSLILHPRTGAERKRVENRTWYCGYRGLLLIHAGKSRAWMDCGVDDEVRVYGKPLVFGAIVGIATMVDCLNIAGIRGGLFDSRYPWLREHPHASGTFCFVLEEPRLFAEPIPYRGMQGLFEIPDQVVAAQLQLLASKS